MFSTGLKHVTRNSFKYFRLIILCPRSNWPVLVLPQVRFFMGRPGRCSVLVRFIPNGLFIITLFEILEPVGEKIRCQRIRPIKDTTATSTTI